MLFKPSASIIAAAVQATVFEPSEVPPPSSASVERSNAIGEPAVREKTRGPRKDLRITFLTGMALGFPAYIVGAVLPFASKRNDSLAPSCTHSSAEGELCRDKVFRGQRIFAVGFGLLGAGAGLSWGAGIIRGFKDPIRRRYAHAAVLGASLTGLLASVAWISTSTVRMKRANDDFANGDDAYGPEYVDELQPLWFQNSFAATTLGLSVGLSLITLTSILEDRHVARVSVLRRYPVRLVGDGTQVALSIAGSF